MADIATPELGTAISGSGLMTQRFWRWVVDITTRVNSLTVVGTGTPEANEVASVGTYYVDTAAAQGDRHWYKQTGDGDTGWLQL